MGQKNIKWTTQQIRAIEEHGRNVFVSASAGTGKTAVLSGSCVDVVTNTSACPDVWSVLVVTFTDMAAEQMRSRIARQLSFSIEAAKDSALKQHLRRQLILLGAADISTIHSFCKRLISGHFYQLDLDPTFGIIDADEAKLLKAEVLEKTIDWAWEQDDLAMAMRQLLARRDLRTSEGFPARIINISEFLDGVVSRDDWFERARILTEAADPNTGDLARGQKQIIEEQLQNALSRLNFALKIYQKNNPNGEWAAKCKRDYIGFVQQIINAGWNNIASEIINFKKPKVYDPNDVPPALCELIGNIIRKSLDTVKEIKDLAILNPDYFDKFSGAVCLQTMALVKLTKQFDLFYKQAKKAINCLDFADLEHYALRLLTKEKTSVEKLEPSETAIELRKKYKYIFVDECQDINRVQQAILDMVSSSGNVFAVGDPKQSIYQWRGARPEIFLEHLKKASTQPTARLGLRVDLNVNFRSAGPILDFVNKVFGRIMTDSFTGINYDQSAYLQPPSKDTNDNSTVPAVELHILDESQRDTTNEDEQAESPSSQLFNSRQLEAAMIARRIKQMVGADSSTLALQIFDKQTSVYRPVEYRDIVILMRSLAGKSDFLEVLRLSAVPVSSEATAGYFEATEITDMLSLLKVLDNPRRDIELAAVLRSPFFHLTDTDLAKIRLSQKKDNNRTSFYDCVIGFHKSDDPALADKLAAVLATLENWRTVARRGRLAELIWHIYRQSGYLSFVCALPQADARRANLLKLHDRAIQFEGFAGNAGVPSLTRFIEFVEKLLAAGQDWSPAEPESAAGNAVRVLSVHKSKGLEFPVVFVADLDGKFSNKDSRQDCLVDEQMTLGLRVIDAENNTKLDSIGYQVIERRARRKSLAEEMRILYVAMTRAINHLVLVGCLDKNSCANKLNYAGFFENETVPDWYLDSCQSHLDWLLCGLSRQLPLHKTFQTTPQFSPEDDNLFSIQFYDQPRLNKLSALIQSVKLKTKNSKLKTKGIAYDLNLLKKSLDWQYPFGSAPLLPAKRTVTQWTHRNDEFTKFDYSMSFNRMPKAVLPGEKVDGKTIGSATHLVISLLDLSKPITAEAITGLIGKLANNGAITETIASLINVESILKFFKTDLGQAALDKNNVVWREWPFTFAIPASQWSQSETLVSPQARLEGCHSRESGNPDFIIVQGIIDLLIKTPKGLVVIDFKTDLSSAALAKSDDVSADYANRRAEIYRTQLDLYARAAAAITGQTVSAKWLYFLRPGLAVSVT